MTKWRSSSAERDQASTDLNGDGDISDSVLHVYDTATGQVINTGLVPVTIHFKWPAI